MQNGRRTAGSRRIPVIGLVIVVACLLFGGHRTWAATDGGIVITKDIPYAEIAGFAKSLTSLDVYSPEGAKGCPVVVFIHGGAWRIGDKKYHRDIGVFFAQEHYVTVNVNYRLSPAVIHPAHVEDVAAAIAWVVRNISRYGGNPSRIFVMGHSAGAHLASLIATDERYLAAHGLGFKTVAGVIPLDGAGFDITELMAAHEGAYGRMYRTAFGNDPDNWADGSPIEHVQPGKSIPPFLVIWAGSMYEARPQTRRFAAVLKGAGVPVETYHAQDKTHVTLLADIGKPADRSTEKILAFLQRLGGKKVP